MSVYVGIDVHRKRSQVAVIDQDGEVLANRNVPNGAEPILRVIGGLPPGTPAAFKAAFGWGWLVELLEAYGFDPHLVHPLQCKAIASAWLKNDPSTPRSWRSCSARTCCPRRGSRRPRYANCGRCCGTASSWSGCGRCCATGSTPSWPTTVTTGRPATGASRGGPGSPPWTCPPSRRRWSRTPWRSSTPWNRSSPGSARPASWRPGPGSPRRCAGRTA